MIGLQTVDAAAMWVLGSIRIAFPAAFAQFAGAVSSMTAQAARAAAQSVPAAAKSVIDAMWQGAAVALGLLLALRLAPRVSAAHRFAAWSAGFALVAALPFLPVLSHFFSVTGVVSPVLAVPSSARPWLELNAAWALAIVGLWLAASALRLAALVSHFVRLQKLWKTAIPVANGGPQRAHRLGGQLALKGHGFSRADNVGERMRALAPEVKGTGFSPYADRLQSIRALAPEVKGTGFSPYADRLQSMGALAPAVHSFEICTTTRLDRPSVIGFFAPRILIPEWLYARLSPQELKQVVLHEIEHLRRHDDWTNLIQKLLLVLFPLNPALAWIERRLCREREMACDEGVVQKTQAPRAYAACLASLAQRGMEREFAARAEALSLAAWRRRPELVHRVHSILWRKPALNPIASRVLLSVVGCGLIAGSVELARCPQVVGFAAPQPHELAQAYPAKMNSVANAPSGAAALAESEAGYHMVQAKAILPVSRNEGVISTPTHTRQAIARPTESEIASREAIDGPAHETLLKAEMPSADTQSAEANQGSPSQPGFVVLAAVEKVQLIPLNSREISDYDTGAASDAQPAAVDGKPAPAAAPQIVIARLIFRVVPAAAPPTSQAATPAAATGTPAQNSSIKTAPAPRSVQQPAMIPFGNGWLVFQL